MKSPVIARSRRRRSNLFFGKDCFASLAMTPSSWLGNREVILSLVLTFLFEPEDEDTQELEKKIKRTRHRFGFNRRACAARQFTSARGTRPTWLGRTRITLQRPFI